MASDLNDLLRKQGSDSVRRHFDSQHARHNGHRRPNVADPPTPQKLIISTEEFVTGFTPPDYLIDGLIQKRFLYSMTAPTGAGKTAIALRLCAHVKRGLRL